MDTLRRVGRGLRIARGIMVVQAVASLGIWVVQVLTVNGRLEHNQDVPGSVRLVIVVNPVIAVLAAVAAAFLLSRPWARSLGVFVESVGCVGSLISVITGFYQAVIAIGLAGVVIALIRRSDAVAETAEGY